MKIIHIVSMMTNLPSTQKPSSTSLPEKPSMEMMHEVLLCAACSDVIKRPQVRSSPQETKSTDLVCHTPPITKRIFRVLSGQYFVSPLPLFSS